MEIFLNEVFEITKGKRKVRWKVINHPYFDDGYALVRNYPYLRSGTDNLQDDTRHIVTGGFNFNHMYQIAYNHT